MNRNMKMKASKKMMMKGMKLMISKFNIPETVAFEERHLVIPLLAQVLLST